MLRSRGGERRMRRWVLGGFAFCETESVSVCICFLLG
jgi:hypothetical protein